MGHVAVHRPVAGIVGDEFDRPCAAYRHKDRRFRPLTASGICATVRLGDLPRMAVNVDRVVIHRREIAEADAHAVAELCQQGRGAGIGARR